jgi:hypothetical protein
MNERIRQLADEAGLRFTQLMSNPMVPVVDGRETDLAKFAELIVKECIETVAENMYSGSTPSDFSDGADFAYAQAISDIKQHFGVSK